jgi:hypothetical protein
MMPFTRANMFAPSAAKRFRGQSLSRFTPGHTPASGLSNALSAAKHLYLRVHCHTTRQFTRPRQSRKEAQRKARSSAGEGPLKTAQLMADYQRNYKQQKDAAKLVWLKSTVDYLVDFLPRVGLVLLCYAGQGTFCFLNSSNDIYNEIIRSWP